MKGKAWSAHSPSFFEAERRSSAASSGQEETPYDTMNGKSTDPPLFKSLVEEELADVEGFFLILSTTSFTYSDRLQRLFQAKEITIVNLLRPYSLDWDSPT